MNYYSYQLAAPMTRMWALFKDMGRMPDDVKSAPDYSHTLDIARAAMNGSIPLTDESLESFNLAAYEYKCRDNDMNNKFSRAKKELFIVEYDNSKDEGGSVGYGDISDRKLQYSDTALERVFDNAEFESALRELIDYRKKYIVEQGWDIVTVMVQALSGVPSAISAIKDFACKDAKISSIIESLCNTSNGELLGVLQGMC